MERMVDDPGVRFGIATGIELLTLTLSGLARLPAAPTGMALVVAAAVVGRRLQVWITAALGVIGWAFFTGFVENTAGELTFTSADLVRLVVIAGSVPVVAKVVSRPIGGCIGAD